MSGKSIVDARKDWRWLPGVLIAGYLLLILGISCSGKISSRQFLQGMGVPALDHPFMDLRGVAAWCEAGMAGKDPSVVETWITIPGELQQRPNFLMNYSPLVLGFGKLGLSGKSVVLWAVGLALIYGISLWFLCGPCTFRQSILWALLICSPASVLVVERGNLDILIFGLLVVALMVRKYPLAESGVILMASLTKFFPIVSLVAPWKERNRNGRLPVIVTLILFVFFLMLVRSHLLAIVGSLRGQYQTAFGSSVMGDLMAHYGLITSGEVYWVSMGLRCAALFWMGISVTLGFLLHRTGFRHPVSERALHAFFLTAPLMLLLFVQGPQMDYKWIFFLFMVPAVLELAGSQCGMESLCAKIWICLILGYSSWTFFSDEDSLRNALLKQLLMWSVIILSAFLTARIWNRRSTS